MRFGVAGMALPAFMSLGCHSDREDTAAKTDGLPKEDQSTMTNEPVDLSVTPFLMFSGDAAKAMKLYTEVFPNSKIENVEEYGADGDGPEGTVRVATMSLNGQKVMCIDSPVKHEFGFTPAISLYVASSDAETIEQYFTSLSDGGDVMMPLGEYPFSKKFAWITDRFGVSWQLATV